MAISSGSRILTLLDDARVWLDLEGALGVGVSMALDFGVLGEDCEAMVVISEKGMKLRRRSGARLRNEEEERAFRFKSTHRAPNTQERNICAEVNVAREDEAERARSQAGQPCQTRGSGIDYRHRIF